MDEDVIIIGGGVIGVSAAYALSKNNISVTLLESKEIASGSSHGNAGLICPCHSSPIPGPGVISQGLKWMPNPSSPFYIKPRLDLEFFKWLWEFQKHCNLKSQNKAIPLLLDLQRQSLQLYKTWLAETGIHCKFQSVGALELFLSEKKYSHAEYEVARMNSFGIKMVYLSRQEVHDIEPAISQNVIGGIHYQEDAHIDPALFVKGLATKAASLGANIIPHQRVISFEMAGGAITRVITSDRDYVPKHVLIAAGIWSSELLKTIKIKLPLQAAKGYSITVNKPGISPAMPLHLAEARMAITPLGNQLRFGGTLELSGLDSSINYRRINAIRIGGKKYLRSKEPLQENSLWAGLRPVSPDGLPYIGRHPQVKNLAIAAGHGMLGVSMGPITGQLVSDILQDIPPGVDLTPFRINRIK